MSPANFGNYLYPDAVLVTIILGQNGYDYGYNVVFDLLGNTTFVNRAPVEEEGSGWYETGAYRTLFDNRGTSQQGWAGGWDDWLGVALDAGDDLMATVGANFHALQAESNALRQGLNFGKEISKVNTTTTTLKWAGRALGAYNAFSIYQSYSENKISDFQFVTEQGSNAYSTLGGINGAAWGLGWEIGRAITTIPAYQKWKQESWLPFRKSTLGY